MATTTISSSETLNQGLISSFHTYVVTGGSMVTVSTGPGIALSAFDTFAVQDSATLELSPLASVGIGDEFEIGANGTLVIDAGVSADVLSATSFVSGTSGGDLVLDSGTSLSVLSGVQGFGYLDSIDFAGAGAPASGSVTTSYSGNETAFTVTTTNGPDVFDLTGNYTADSFSLSSDGGSGFNFTDETPCFAGGTRILTAEGEIAVEQLRLGDMAVLENGEMSPIVFIGKRSLDLRRHAQPETARPVRVRAGALADGAPCRDLLLSQDHALFLDGVLIPARDLVDGAMIVIDNAIERVTYYHVELQSHGVLLAEGVPAESFLNVGHRGLFENVDEPIMLHPQLMHRAREDNSVAPLVTSGPRLAAIRARLHARARLQGYGVAERRELTLRAAGRVLTPEISAAGVTTFILPPGATEAVLASATFSPAETDPASPDRRTLGVALTALRVNGQAAALPAVMEAADLHDRAEGEQAVWTRGTVRLRLPPGTGTLTLDIAGWPQCWSLPRTRRAAVA